MSQGSIENALAGQMLRLARDATLRGMVYDRLGDYCHQCRNRLNSLKLMIYLMTKQCADPTVGVWEEVNRHYRDLERKVEQIQTLCRPMTVSRVTLALDLLIDDRREAWTRTMIASGGSLEMIPPGSRTESKFDVERLGGALDALVEWRAGEVATGRPARLRWWVEQGVSHICWEEPVRPETGVRRAPTAGDVIWALPLLVRVVEAHGGDCRVEESGGWRLDGSWPTPNPAP